MRTPFRSLILPLYALFVGGAAVWAIAMLQDGQGPSWVVPIVLAGLTTAVALLLLLTVRGSDRSARQYPVSIALAGSPGVGKTVFANVVEGLLMEGHGDGLVFTAEPQTARSVTRTLVDISEGKWPAPTKMDGVRLYKGRLGERNPRLLTRLIRGRVEFRLELGDSAGEHWENMGDGHPRGDSRWLVDSAFFPYVSQSDVILYFFDAARLRNSPEQVRRGVDDLLSAVHQLRSRIDRGDLDFQLPIPRIGIVVAKADALSPAQREIVSQLLFGHAEFSIRDAEVRAGKVPLASKFATSIGHLERAVATLDRIDMLHQGFVLSSIDGAVAAGIVDPPVPGDRPPSQSAIRHRQIQGVMAPIYWAIRQSWRS